MDTRNLLLVEHGLIHSAAVVAATDTQVSELVWVRTNDGQRRQCIEGHNSLAWIFWHMARVEDVYVNRLIRGVPELLDREDWLKRLGVDTREIGTGDTETAVEALSQRIDLMALKEYRDAVGRETRSWLANMDIEQLDDLIDMDERLAETPRYFDPERAAWVNPAGQKRKVASIWTWGVIGHSYVHLGEAGHVTRTLGIPGR